MTNLTAEQKEQLRSSLPSLQPQRAASSSSLAQGQSSSEGQTELSSSAVTAKRLTEAQRREVVAKKFIEDTRRRASGKLSLGTTTTTAAATSESPRPVVVNRPLLISRQGTAQKRGVVRTTTGPAGGVQSIGSVKVVPSSQLPANSLVGVGQGAKKVVPGVTKTPMRTVTIQTKKDQVSSSSSSVAGGGGQGTMSSPVRLPVLAMTSAGITGSVGKRTTASASVSASGASPVRTVVPGVTTTTTKGVQGAQVKVGTVGGSSVGAAVRGASVVKVGGGGGAVAGTVSSSSSSSNSRLLVRPGTGGAAGGLQPKMLFVNKAGTR